MGDWSFFRLLEDLAFASEPLITGLANRFEPFGDAAMREAYVKSPLDLSPFGQAVMAEAEDHVAVNGIDRWWAGTHLSGYDAWRFNRSTLSLAPPSRGG